MPDLLERLRAALGDGYAPVGFGRPPVGRGLTTKVTVETLSNYTNQESCMRTILQITAGLAEVRRSLGPSGAAARAAEAILSVVAGRRNVD